MSTLGDEMRTLATKFDDLDDVGNGETAYLGFVGFCVGAYEGYGKTLDEFIADLRAIEKRLARTGQDPRLSRGRITEDVRDSSAWYLPRAVIAAT